MKFTNIDEEGAVKMNVVITIIGIFLTLLLFLLLEVFLNMLNDKRRQVDPVFDVYLTKNNIRTKFTND